MQVYDIVQIVGPVTQTSYPVNSRTFITHFYDESAAVKTCELYNECRNCTDYRYEVEEHDEESPNRADPVK